MKRDQPSAFAWYFLFFRTLPFPSRSGQPEKVTQEVTPGGRYAVQLPIIEELMKGLEGGMPSRTEQKS